MSLEHIEQAIYREYLLQHRTFITIQAIILYIYLNLINAHLLLTPFYYWVTESAMYILEHTRGPHRAPLNRGALCFMAHSIGYIYLKQGGYCYVL